MSKFYQIGLDNIKGVKVGKNTTTIFDIVDKPLLINLESSYQLDIESNGEAEILVNISNTNDVQKTLKISNKGKLNVVILVKENNSRFGFNNIVENDGDYHQIIVDFSKGNNNIYNSIINSKIAKLQCASVAEKDNIKYIKNELINIKEFSDSFMDNYAVSFDNAKLTIEGVGHIKKSANKSSNIQKATLFVMDKTSKVECKPILLIDTDDVKASHANALGEISEESLFYLQSRGIELDRARKMIVLGYFKKFSNDICYKEVKEEVESYIEEVIKSV